MAAASGGPGATAQQPPAASQFQSSPPSHCDDVAVFRSAGERRGRRSFALSIVLVGLVSFAVSTYVVSQSGVGDERLEGKFSQQISEETYQWPMVAFATAFALNFLTVLFERETAKFQLAFLACYINALAGFSDFLAWRGMSPIVEDVWGRPIHIIRVLMWLHTTPIMVYLLSIISDFKRSAVYLAMAADVLMISLSCIAHFTPHRTLSVFIFTICFGLFAFVIRSMWRMFDAAVEETKHDRNRASLRVLRAYTVGLWFAFPLTFMLSMFGVVSLVTEEWMWTIGDFLGKVMFSSSLLYGNFLTIEQRRLIAMRVVEEGNRVQVIQELKDLVEQKERFLSSMSHELRTPLNGIIGLSDALLVGGCGTANEQKTITTIKTSGSRLLNLINDILDAASMRKGKLIIKQEKVNLNHIAEDVLSLCQPLTKRGVRLVSDVRDTLPPVLGDAGRIIQIFHNLIGNSCKFTHNGYISITAAQRGSEVEVSVSDTGIGIPEDKFEQIFMAFEQVDMSTTRKYGGTGLGLNLVKQLVEAHGGSIRVKSKIDQGTTFQFTLKVWDEKLLCKDTGSPPYCQSLNADGDRTSESGLRSGRNSDPAARLVAQDKHSPASRSTSFSKPPEANPRRGVSAATSQSSLAGANKDAPEQAARTRPVRRTPSQPSLNAPRKQQSCSRFSTTTVATNPSGHAHEGPSVAGSGLTPLKDAVQVATGVIKRRMSVLRRREAGVKLRVLSVDDDPVNQMVIQNLLAPEGYEILQAMDGQEALSLVEDEDDLPDVILLDVMMPGMSGYEVCRRLREMHPLRCVPVIMISAKSKEENIVEGLVAGSNDYVVKPFGRQEILARIAAHLRFRDNLIEAAESAASYDASSTTVSSVLASCLEVDSHQTAVPDSMKPQLQREQATTMHLFNQVTMVVASISNLPDLLSQVSAVDVAAVLARFHTALQTLVMEHRCQLVEGLDNRIVVVCGVASEYDQVQRCLALSEDLVELADSLAVGVDRQPLRLAVGLHTSSAQGMVVGMEHPVLYFAGNLPATAEKLHATCPTNCVHVSSAVFNASKTIKSQFAQIGLELDGIGPSYLLKTGGWEAGWEAAEVLIDRYMCQHPFGPINVAAKLMRPLQQALMTLVMEDPGALLGVAPMTASPAPPPPQRRSTGPPQESKAAPANDAALAKVKEENTMLEKQLEEVSEEAGRLQDLCDSLEAQVKELKEAAAAAPAPATTAAGRRFSADRQSQASLKQQVEEAGRAKDDAQARVVELERQLESKDGQCRALEAQARELEARLEETQNALHIAHATLAALEEQLAAQQAASAAAQASAARGSNSNQGSPAGMQLPQQHSRHGRTSNASASGMYIMASDMQNTVLSGPTVPHHHMYMSQQPCMDTIMPMAYSSPSNLAGGNSGGYSMSRTLPSRRPSQLQAMHIANLQRQHAAAQRSASAGAGMLGIVPSPMLVDGRCSWGSGGGGGGSNLSGPGTGQSLQMQSQHHMSVLNSSAGSPAMQQHRGMPPDRSRNTSVGLLGSGPNACAAEGDSMAMMQAMLAELGLEALWPRFEAEEVTPSLLAYLDDEGMRELGVVSVGARAKLRMAALSVAGRGT